MRSYNVLKTHLERYSKNTTKQKLRLCWRSLKYFKSIAHSTALCCSVPVWASNKARSWLSLLKTCFKSAWRKSFWSCSSFSSCFVRAAFSTRAMKGLAVSGQESFSTKEFDQGSRRHQFYSRTCLVSQTFSSRTPQNDAKHKVRPTASCELRQPMASKRL